MSKFISIGFAMLTIAILNACTPTRVSDHVKLADMNSWHNKSTDSIEATRTPLKVMVERFPRSLAQ